MRKLAAAVLTLFPLAGRALELRSPDGDLFAFPTLSDERGNALATSTFEQWREGGKLNVRITHAFPDGRRWVERARFARGGELDQEWWSFQERRGEEVLRAFEVDLLSGHATARKREDGREKTWDEQVKVERGRTFAGLGVTYAVKNLRDRLVAGEDVDFRAVGFLPKPVSAGVEAKHVGRERIDLGSRKVEADKFEVRIDLKGLEKVVDLFKDPAGADVWLHHGRAPMILRIRYRPVEPSEPVVVMETLGAPRDPGRSRSARTGR